MAADADRPVTVEEMSDQLDDALAHGAHFVIAVSGGADSTCLLHLTAQWAARRPRVSLSVATVDHRLRPDSAEEAAQVAIWAAALRLPHVTLAWNGPRPRSGLQQAARAARHRLLRAHAAEIGANVLLLGHTQSDQNETVLMRLARGSGVDGLAAMRPVVRLDDLVLVRPLLAQPRSRIEATLRAAGVPWLEDPSNDRTEFERVRIRRTLPALTGIGLTAAPVARSARRLARASEALESLTSGLLRPEAGIVRLDPLGFAEIRWQPLLAHPAELRLRLLGRVIGLVGGAPPPLSLARLEALTEGLGWRLPGGRTLARVVLGRCRSGDLRLLREHRRGTPPPCGIAAGRPLLFDGRFEVRLHRELGGAEIRWMGDARESWKAQLARPAGVPAAALATLPVLWVDGQPCAVPHLGYFAGGLGPGDLSVAFPLLPPQLAS